MSLLKLLSVGRSFIGMSDTSRYTVVEESFLPKFSEPHSRRAASAPRFRETMVPKPAAPASPEELEQLAQRTVAAVRAKSLPRLALEKRVRLPWWRRINPFSSPPAEERRGAVQTEMLLDAVKPLRNDLCDVDVEVVRVDARASGVPAEAPALVTPTPVPETAGEQAAAPELAAARSGSTAWGELSSKLFQAGKNWM